MAEMNYNDAQMQLLGMVAGSVATTTALTKILVQAGIVDPEEFSKQLDLSGKDFAFPKNEAAQKGLHIFLDAVKIAAKEGAKS